MAGTPVRLPTVLATLALSPADLDMAAVVTPLDLIMGRALWQRFCPARYLDMLDAMMGGN